MAKPTPYGNGIHIEGQGIECIITNIKGFPRYSHGNQYRVLAHAIAKAWAGSAVVVI